MTQPAHAATQVSKLVLQTSVAAHVDVPAAHESAVSSQVSVPLHATPSEQMRAVPLQAPARQVSPSVQNAPSSQRAPALSLQEVRDEATVQTWQAFVGFTCPAPKQLPPITQPLQVATQVSVVGSQSAPPLHVVVPAAQALVASLHVSAPLQAMPSPQLRAVPPQVVPVQRSPSVQNAPSSHVAPSFVLHAEREDAVAQTSHWFIGLR